MTGWLYNVLRPAPAAVPSPEPVVQESVWDAPFDPDADHSAANLGSAFVRKLTSRTIRDIPELQFVKGMQYAYYLSVSNPLAKGILKLTRSFVCGDGITVSATDEEDPEGEEIQRVIDRFWTDERNHMDMTLPEMVYELALFGEQIPTVFVNPVDGHVRLGLIDPEEVHDIICEPGNITHPIAIEVKPLLGQTARPRYKIVAEEEDVNDRWYGRLKGVETRQGIAEDGKPTLEVTETYTDAHGDEQPYAGACFLFQINKVRNRKRGQSDLMDLLDWVDAYGQLLFNDVDRSLLMKSFIFDVSVQGSPQEVDKFMQENKRAPDPGAVRVHTDKITWNTVTPDLKAHDTQMTADLLISLIATGSGLAKHWLNSSMDVNRANGESMTEPSIKMLTERQQFVKYMLERIVRFTLDQAEMAGRLPKRAVMQASVRPEPWPIVVHAPEIGTKDLKAITGLFSELVQALSVALADKAIDIQTYQDLLAFTAKQLGFEIDLDEMRQRLEDQQSEQDALEPADEPVGIGNGNGVEDMPGMQGLAVLARGSS